MSLRPQDPIPDWITHLAIVRDGQVAMGMKKDILAAYLTNVTKSTRSNDSLQIVQERPKGRVLAEMNNINVQYEDRKVTVPITISAGVVP